MFGIGLYETYSSVVIEALGGTNAALLVAIAIRVLVGVGWYMLFEKAGKKGFTAFLPLYGPYQAFRLVWDDFSFAAIFAATTFIAFVHAIGVDHSIINAFSVVNFLLWWFMALLTSRAYDVSIMLSFIYAGIPWFGALLIGFWPSGHYKGPWSSDPENEQNLTAQERKKRRKKAAKEAKKS
ncbi:MAG: hypothetical protein J6D34_11445 [Atopobiaceae bacterium]|nr:hypothetical protein [Atopobiaceae bacterium]